LRAAPAAALLLLALAACIPTGRQHLRNTVPTGPPPAAFRALYQIRAEGAGGRLRAKAWIAVDAGSGRFAAEVLGPMGGTRAQMDADPARIRAYLTKERVLLDEASGPATMQAALGLPLRTEDLVELLRGRRPGGGRTPPAQFRGEDGIAWQVDWVFRDGPLPMTLTFQGPNGRLELEMLKPAVPEPPPAPFQPPAGARPVDPEAFRALLIP
jgi:hypothetical protein